MIPIAYRGYTIFHVSGKFRAVPSDQDDQEIFTDSLDSMVMHIDELWDALESRAACRPPAWLASWMRHPTKDLWPDAYAKARSNRRCKQVAAVAAMFIAIIGARFADIDGNGVLNNFDAHAVISYFSSGRLSQKVRMVTIDGQIADYELTYIGNPQVPMQVTKKEILY